MAAGGYKPLQVHASDLCPTGKINLGKASSVEAATEEVQCIVVTKEAISATNF